MEKTYTGKFKVGDMVQSKVGGPKMMVIHVDVELEHWHDDEENLEDYGWQYDRGYKCKYFIDRKSSVSVANSSSSTHGSGASSSSTANAKGLKDFTTQDFYEYELKKAR